MRCCDGRFDSPGTRRLRVSVSASLTPPPPPGVSGGAGTGKSFLLQRIISALPPESTWVTASTGAAACQVQGVTLHSFAGLGRAGGSLEQCVQLASRPGVIQHWKRCKHLVIDEISMVDADFFQVSRQPATRRMMWHLLTGRVGR